MSQILIKNKGGNNKIETGDFNVNNQVIAGGVTYTIEIPLGRSDYNVGEILAYVPNSILLTANKRTAIKISFTTAINDALALSGGRSTYNVYGYNFTDYWMKGYLYDDDSKLSDVYFFDNGSQTGLRGQLRVESCQIIGNKIEFKFKNTHGSRNTNLTLKGIYNVYRS